MRIDHVLVRARDLEAMCAFFTRGIGLEVGPRPNFAFPGYWLYAEGVPVIHLRDAGDAAPATGNDQGWPVDHIAFSGDDYAALVRRLEENGVTFAERLVPGGEVHQVFASGPEGVRVEVQFPASDVPVG